MDGVNWLQLEQPCGQELQVRMEELRKKPGLQAEQSEADPQLAQFSRQLLQDPLLR